MELTACYANHTEYYRNPIVGTWKNKTDMLVFVYGFEAYTNDFSGFDTIYLFRAHCDLLNINSNNLESKL